MKKFFKLLFIQIAQIVQIVQKKWTYLPFKILILSSLLTGGSFFLFQNCSDVKLEKYRSVQPAPGKGDVCLKGPSKAEAPQKVIFFLDQTESMQGTDPARANPLKKAKRVEALRELIDFYKNNDNFYISLGYVKDRTAGFLNESSDANNLSPLGGGACVSGKLFYRPKDVSDYQKLQTILDTQDVISQKVAGGTSFSDFLLDAKDCVTQDFSVHGDSNYSVVLVTDGQDNNSTVDFLKDAIRKLIIAGKSNLTDKNSHVNFFLYLINKDPDVISYMISLLNEARNSGGVLSGVYPYTEDNLSNMSYLGIKLFNRKKYRIQKFYATNMNAAISDGNGLISIDSDGDGVSDEEEVNPPYGRLATDPSTFSSSFSKKSQDTKFQCSDKVFIKYGSCPSACGLGESLADSDHDGLSNCDESSEYMTDKTNFDSDADEIPDGLEVRIGSNPIQKDDTIDQSGDGIDNFHKALSQMSAKFNNRGVRNRFLTKTEFVFTREYQGMNCYHLSVSDLPLFNTLSVSNEDPSSNTIDELRHGAGGNVIKFVIYMVPEDDSISNPTILYTPRPKLLYYEDFGDSGQSFSDLSDKDFIIYEK